ncbi:MAG: pantetheine-phosphate adenylyltransferase [Schleiferilactobacillus perolens]|jgi:pantetheine-phosphate adenylyltransferase|uniref:Phosphopantetheine adenylyltransferase n=1 Tax=Schleiferilactobacillus perolens DSM 12744 TaxID=1423792 RepID=A0A0R1N918_9LACO|nr:pantetheine-phosphate adenylyltransferase [Schleiferilactobacillus perolens]KRL14178.1 phosphopantetheine adenylyltransferase [Schleiferilactobacillus perolens DSM 12744]MCI1892281.1 pantetheine-phosphate adenylyltransferase [Schleiferilactobacillus harbinensis]MCI1913193.1 pantetheine-phosphate adenylyltransferase [Schleiferilactobacillus harbinensis]
MKRIALFPGSFDPFTNGHLQTVQRASRLFDEIVIAVMTNVSKHALFTPDEKEQLVTEAIAHLPNVRVMSAPNQLTVQVAESVGAHFLLRGLRNEADFTYEAGIAQINRTQDADIETVFLYADSDTAFVSSSMIKEVAHFGGDVSTLVPANVAAALHQKFAVQGRDENGR